MDAHTAAVLRLGMNKEAVVEAAAAIDLFAGLCSLAEGLRLESDSF